MRVFVTGAGGQLGFDVVKQLLNANHDVVASDLAELSYNMDDVRYEKLDITDKQSVFHVIDATKPDVIIHCAAWTAVDAAEDEENREKVRAINIDGTKNLAFAAKKIDAKLIYISTDYVFNGQGELPWKSDCREFAPLNVYGKTKLEGEFAVVNTLEKYFIVRISWVFGLNGNNFVKTMLQLGKIHEQVRVVNDQIGTPTYTYDLARLLVDLAESDKYGYYHASNEGGYISWAEFAKEIYRQVGLHTEVLPVTTAEYGYTKAYRPLNSRLEKEKLKENGFSLLPPWKDALGRYLQELEKQGEF